jgi:hypothetical protein
VLGPKRGATAHFGIAGGDVFAKDGRGVGRVFVARVFREIDDGAAIEIGKDAVRAIKAPIWSVWAWVAMTYSSLLSRHFFFEEGGQSLRGRRIAAGIDQNVISARLDIDAVARYWRCPVLGDKCRSASLRLEARLRKSKASARRGVARRTCLGFLKGNVNEIAGNRQSRHHEKNQKNPPWGRDFASADPDLDIGPTISKISF